MLFKIILIFIVIFSILLRAETFNMPGSYYYTFLFIFSLYILIKSKEIKKSIVLLIVMIFIYFISTIFTFFIDYNIGSLTSNFMYFLLSILLIVHKPFISLRSTLYIILLSGVSIIAYPIVIFGIDSSPYMSIFNNPNTLGNITATLFTVSFSLFLLHLVNFFENKDEKFKLFKLLSILLISLFLVYLTMLSGSRTSLVSISLVLILGIILFTFLTFRKENNLKYIIYIFPLILIGTLLSSYFIMNSEFANYMISKFNRKGIISSDALDGRSFVWSYILNNITFIGRGQNFFVDYLGLGAHSLYIFVLGAYGLISFIPFITIHIILLWKALKCYIKNSINHLVIILILTNLLTLGIAENQYFRFSMIVCILVYPYLYNDYKKLSKRGYK